MKKKKQKVLFILAPQTTNYGDFIINYCLIKEISKHRVVYIFNSSGAAGYFLNPIYDLKNVYPIERILNIDDNKFKTLALVLKVRSIFSHAVTSPGPSALPNKYRYLKSFLYLVFFKILKSSKIEILKFGTEINVDTLFNSWFFKKIVNDIHSHTYIRNHKNIQELSDRGFKRVSYTPDMCLLNIKKKKPQYESSLKKNILISFKNEDNKEELVRFLSRFVPFYTSKGYIITFFHQVKEDEKFNKYLFSNFRNTSTELRDEILWNIDFNDFENVFAVVSNRLHVLLPAIINGALPYAFIQSGTERGNKIENVYESLEVDEFIVHRKKSYNEEIVRIHNLQHLLTNAMDKLFSQKKIIQEIIYKHFD